MGKRGWLADGLSLGNLLLGFFAVAVAGEGKLETAAWLVIAAAALDSLDGTVARLMRREGRFGKELDSLADMVSFGLAPALVLSKVMVGAPTYVAMGIAFLPAAAGALRLARFNTMSVGDSKPQDFIGMPITAGGVVIASFLIYTNHLDRGAAGAELWTVLVVMVSALMVSPIPYWRLANRIGGRRGVSGPVSIGVGLVTVILAAAIWNPAAVMFPVFLAYLLSGPVFWLGGHLNALLKPKPRPEVPAEPVRAAASARLGRRNRYEGKRGKTR